MAIKRPRVARQGEAGGSFPGCGKAAYKKEAHTSRIREAQHNKEITIGVCLLGYSRFPLVNAPNFANNSAGRISAPRVEWAPDLRP